MPNPPLPDEVLRHVVEVWWRHERERAPAAAELGISQTCLDHRLKTASRRGLVVRSSFTGQTMPGFEIASVSTTEDADGTVVRTSIRQRPEAGDVYEVPPGHIVRGKSTLVDADGRVLNEWVKTRADDEARHAALLAAVEGFKDDIPRAEPSSPPGHTNADLASQYTVTDLHLGMLAWAPEAGADYDLATAEDLLRRFITAAVEMSPPSAVGILAQLGDFLHYDSLKPITPEHGNLLDSGSRFGEIVRAAIRVLRWTVAQLLSKHESVHVIMADANHDPASGVWLREMFAAFFEDEPRVSVDTSADTYYCYEHGRTALFYHHGHRRKPKDVDGIFAGRFREVYGRTEHAYAHLGHRHSDELITTNLMKVEQHETMAAKDAYAAHGGWPSGRSAKVIHYSKRHGEVSRHTLTPGMLGA